MIRQLRNGDLESIDHIWRQHHAANFGLPSLDNTITSAVIEIDKQVTAFGYVKLFAEAILVLDLNASRRNKVNAINLLMSEAIRGTSAHNLSQLHAFIQDEHFAHMMKKHFGFEKCKGEALSLELS